MNELHVYTDGSCINQADVNTRRAGIGVAFGKDHAYNLSEPLLGDIQNSARAEMVAVVRAMERAEKEGARPLVIHCDSSYAVLEMNRILHPKQHKQYGAGERKNGDVIKQMARLVLLRKASVKIVKIPRAVNVIANDLAQKAARAAYTRANKQD